MRFSFGQLDGFVAVAEELHFGRAAARLNMTQPPLSRQIQKLEQAVGVQLFDRDNRGVRLTPAGDAFLHEARRLLAWADRAPNLARRIAAGTSGTIRIGFTLAATYGPLGRVLNTIDDAAPGLHIELFEMVTGEQVAALESGEIDLGLARPPFDTETFRSRLLHHEPLLLCVPKGHPLAALERPITAEDLRNQPLVMHAPTKARYFYDLVVGHIRIDHANIVHSVGQVPTMIWLVEAGRGVAFVPASAARMGVPGVRFLDLTGFPHNPVELHLLWPTNSPNPALANVLDLLADVRP